MRMADWLGIPLTHDMHVVIAAKQVMTDRDNVVEGTRGCKEQHDKSERIDNGSVVPGKGCVKSTHKLVSSHCHGVRKCMWANASVSGLKPHGQRGGSWSVQLACGPRHATLLGCTSAIASLLRSSLPRDAGLYLVAPGPDLSFDCSDPRAAASPDGDFSSELFASDLV